MNLTPELPEILGMLVADGCLQPGYLCMWENITEDRDYYDQYIVPLFERTFNVKLRPHEKKSNGVYGFYLCRSKLIREISKCFGYPIGKKTHTIKVPQQISNSKNSEVIGSFVRGYFDCDGSFSCYVK